MYAYYTHKMQSFDLSLLNQRINELSPSSNMEPLRFGYQRQSNETIIPHSGLVDPNLTHEENFEKFGLNFDPLAVEIFHNMGIDEDNELNINGTYSADGRLPREQAICKGYKGIINSRTGNLLGIGKKGWTPLHNNRIKEIGQKYVDAGILTLESVTLQNGGADCIIQYAINGTETDVTTGDPVKRRVSFVNSFSQSTSFMCSFYDVRLACFNQMQSVRKDGRNIIIKHTSSIDRLVRALPDHIDWAKRDFDVTVQQLRELNKVTVSQDKLVDVFKYAYQDKLKGTVTEKDGTVREKRYTDLDREWSAVRQQFIKETDKLGSTAYAIHQAITHHQTHIEGRTNNPHSVNAARIRFNNLINPNGSNSQRINRSFERCLALTR